MRTRFVIHKNLLSPVFRVLPRSVAHQIGYDEWNPEDILVANPERRGAWFILPKSEYVPCDKNGVVKEQHADDPRMPHADHVALHGDKC